MVRKLTVSAILTALAAVFLVLSATMPTARLSLFFMSNVSIAAVVLVAGVRYALLAYAATVLCALFLYPSNLSIIAFAVLFGYYPVLKLYIEKAHSLWAEWSIKVLVFCVFVFGSMLFIKEIPWYIWGALFVGLVLYDILLSYVITYLARRFSFLIMKINR